MFNYTGGKSGSGVYQQIINQIPPHEIYVEGFLGGGSIMSKKRAARINIGIDADADLIEHWDLVAPSNTVVSAATINIGDVGQYHQEQRCELAPPVTTVTACTTSNGGMDGYQFICAKFLEWLPTQEIGSASFIYCDPPYLGSTRKSQRNLYRCEMKEEDQHIELIEALLELDCMVALSGYQSDLYDEMLTDWRRVEFQANTQSGPATEILWMNYPEPARLHDYRYLGSDYRERERIKKKKNRWASKWRSMPALERYAILSAIEDVENV